MPYYKPNETYYQPTNEWCNILDIPYFEVWETLENGMNEHPEVPRDEWLEYHDDDIVEHYYVDLA